MTQTYASGLAWYESLPAELQAKLEGIIIWDGYYSAILGYIRLPDTDETVLVYDRDKAVAELATDFASDAYAGVGDPEDYLYDDEDDARNAADEFISYNVEGCYAGAGTPLMLTRQDDQPEIPGLLGFATRCALSNIGYDYVAVFDTPVDHGFTLPNLDDPETTVPTAQLIRITGEPDGEE